MNASTLKKAWKRYWTGVPICADKLAFFRGLFFFLVGLDSWIQVAHAPRYGAGDFNVAHFAILDAILPMPSNSFMVALYLLSSLLAFRIAIGRRVRASVIALVTCVGYSYFVSQLDAYQHHYLLFLLLVISCLLPWDNPRPTSECWPLRLFVVQLAIVYVFAALSKLDSAWLDGTALRSQISSGPLLAAAETLGWGILAKLTVVTEIALGLLLFWRRAWPWCWPVGLVFHVGIATTELQIGLFSYFMCAFYLLLMPDRWFAKIANSWRRRTRGSSRVAPVWLVSIAVVGAARLFFLLPFARVWPALAIFAFIVLLDWKSAGSAPKSRAGLGFAGAVLLVVGLPTVTNTVLDHYRYQGGDALRMGNVTAAVFAYDKAVAAAPRDWRGHWGLAKAHRASGSLDLARESALVALSLTPDDAEHGPLRQRMQRLADLSSSRTP